MTQVSKLRPSLTNIEETLFVTTCARAMDARSGHSILADNGSAAIVDRIDYDYAKLKLDRKLSINTALRAKHLDVLVAQFIEKNPGATVVDIGCGLDTRMERIKAPVSVRWYDVDLPDVIALRRKFFPETDRRHLIAADLTDPRWLETIPSDGPSIIVADGVIPFLKVEDAKALFRGIPDHFRSGEIVLNGYTTLAVRLMPNHPTMKALGVTGGAGFDDPREPERWSPKLLLVETQSLIGSPYLAPLSWGYRATFAMLRLLPFMRREGGRVLRYRFPASQ